MKLETVKKYDKERRGDWWFMPLWKKILYVIIFPFVLIWLSITWCIMKLGRGIYQLGDLLSGFRWNHKNWLEDV